jgi:hypothetical protein
MNTPTATSRKFADDLAPGVHHLSNKVLRDVYGVKRLTATARAGFAADLERAGLEVLSDPAREPLTVRKPVARAAVAARPRSRARSRRPWAIGAAAVVLLVAMIAVLVTSSAPAPAPLETQAGTTPGTEVPTTPTAPIEPAPSAELAVDPVGTFVDAQEAVQDEEFGEAIAIAAAISATDRNRIRRAISRRLARQARTALGDGDRGAARRALLRADAYGRTPEIRGARASYRAAVVRAADRAAARVAAREVVRRQAAEGRAARRAALAAAQAADAAESVTPDVDDVSLAPDAEESGASTTNWCGKRDGDGDGLYCE